MKNPKPSSKDINNISEAVDNMADELQVAIEAKAWRTVFAGLLNRNSKELVRLYRESLNDRKGI